MAHWQAWNSRQSPFLCLSVGWADAHIQYAIHSHVIADAASSHGCSGRLQSARCLSWGLCHALGAVFHVPRRNHVHRERSTTSRCLPTSDERLCAPPHRSRGRGSHRRAATASLRVVDRCNTATATPAATGSTAGFHAGKPPVIRGATGPEERVENS